MNTANQSPSEAQTQQIQAAQQLAQQQLLQAFWNNQLIAVEQSDPDFKTHALPIARIKKVMKSDDEVKSLMISAEAPILFAKACEIFIEELSLRAWMHAEENKRRTLQRSDIAMAVSKSDMYDFLIDIVPRDLELLKATGMKNKGEEMYPPPDSYGYPYPASMPPFQGQQQEYSAYQPLPNDTIQQYHLQQLQYPRASPTNPSSFTAGPPSPDRG